MRSRVGTLTYGGVCLVAVLAAGPGVARAQDDPCPAAAVVTGDQDLARRATSDLARRGVVAEAPAGCRRVRATIERRGERIRVAVDDGYGRRSEREVRDLATATALVESWTRQEVVVAMLPPEPAPPAAPPVVVLTAAPPAVAGAAGGLALALESSLATDSTTWLGGSVSGCALLGPVCAGGILRGAVDTGWSGEVAHSRRGADLLATAELPLGRGGFTLAPGLAVGIGWLQTDELGPHHDQTSDTGGVRAGALLRLSRALAGGFSIGLSLSADRWVVGGDAVPAEGGEPIAPTGQLRAGLGLRYGGP
jgi:hypothetical protein